MGQLTKQQAGLTESTAIRTLARTFTYDPSGNLQQSDTCLFTGGQFERSQTTYQYDPLGRIEHAHSQGNGKSQYHERFRFDPAHNLIERDNQVIKNNRLSHYGGVGFTYDSLGNTLATTYDKDNRVSYRYDLHDRLIGAEITTRYRKESWVYYYDAVGRRIAKAKLNKQGEPEIHTTFVWDGSHLVQEIQKGKNSQENDRTFTYIYRHPNSYEPLAQCIDRRDEQGNRIEHEINYFHCDQIGIPREMTDSQGKVIWRGGYDAWGGLHYDRHLAQQNQGYQPFRLQNQYIDQETGLHYNFLRYYEPMTGRFISQDPIGLVGGNNLYLFGLNAQSWIDIYGLAGILTIYSSGDSLLGGHSWVSYTPDGGVTTTYGTWGNNPTGQGNGLFTNLELGRSAQASRTMRLDDEAEKRFNAKVEEYRKQGASAWNYGKPCSSFARDVWNAGTNENLNSNILGGVGFISNPQTLKESIIKANGGEVSAVGVSPNTGSSASFGSIGRTSGSSLNSSGSSLN
ncbi:hypothetical protein E5343_07140 [Rodentibacter caecimuris]|uniref:RHS repeat domain-containing protein n=1 Tax=Rodentibacter caecimuris TaxID=1796644 RepID=UPI0010949941|nr:RHS repeat-associated core domain-containing protein [Pasteurella caecimuris]TGY49363.1 hypothetical protein E5343_07140 [Pasteurella caecimuris]